MIIPLMFSSLRFFSQTSANFFQSGKDMFSDHFVKGIWMMGLQIFFSSGAMFRISSLSVEITPPDFGSSLEEIVPPVITIATFGNCELVVRFAGSSLRWQLVVDISVILALRISFSLIPMLYPDFSFRRIISGSCDCRAWPSQTFPFVWIFTLSPGVKIIGDNFGVSAFRYFGVSGFVFI